MHLFLPKSLIKLEGHLGCQESGRTLKVKKIRGTFRMPKIGETHRMYKVGGTLRVSLIG